MSKNAILAIVAIVIVALLVAGYFYFMSGRTEEDAKLMEEQKNLEKAQEAIKKVAEVPQIGIPSVDSLDKALPKVNPIEKTNPFKTKNPFGGQ